MARIRPLKRRIVCAAVKTNSGVVVCGVRHYDMVMHRVLAEMKFGQANPPPEQGFIDNRGEFLNRQEALKIADAAGQILNKTHPYDQLFSEDIY